MYFRREERLPRGGGGGGGGRGGEREGNKLHRALVVPRKLYQLSSPAVPTSRDILHEYLEDALLAGGAVVLDNVLVLEMLVQLDFLLQGLELTGDQKGI